MNLVETPDSGVLLVLFGNKTTMSDSDTKIRNLLVSSVKRKIDINITSDYKCQTHSTYKRSRESLLQRSLKTRPVESLHTLCLWENSFIFKSVVSNILLSFFFRTLQCERPFIILRSNSKFT